MKVGNMAHKRRNIDKIGPNGKSTRNARPLDWLEIAGHPYPHQYPWLATFGEGDDRCFVYVIAPEGKWPVKVGISSNPKSRLFSLQGANWKRLRVEHCCWTATRAQALAIEKYLHAEFAEGGKWLLGEWVDARPDEAKERIEWASMTLSIPVDFTIPADKEAEVWKRLKAMWPVEAIYEANARKTEMVGY
jgi:hypothetical protein